MKYKVGQMCRMIKNVSGGFPVGAIVKIVEVVEEEDESYYICEGIYNYRNEEFFQTEEELEPVEKKNNSITKENLIKFIDINFNELQAGGCATYNFTQDDMSLNDYKACEKVISQLIRTKHR